MGITRRKATKEQYSKGAAPKGTALFLWKNLVN